MIVCSAHAVDTVDVNGHGYFERGLRAFEQKKYSEALQLFLEARSQGMQTARLHYNLGMVYYRLRDYDKVLLELPQAALQADLAFMSYINMSLAAYRLGDIERSRLYLRTAQQLARGETQKKIARRIITGIHGDPERYQMTVQLQAGYHENLIEHDTGANKELDDGFSGLTFQTKWNPRRLFGFAVTLSTLDYERDSAYDSRQISLSAELAASRVKMSLRTDEFHLGGNRLMGRHGLDLAIPFVAAAVTGELRYVYQRFQYDQGNLGRQYAHLDGDMNALDLLLYRSGRGGYTGLELSVEANNRRNLVRDGLHSDFSPQRATFKLKAGARLRRYRVDTWVQYRLSRHKVEDDISVGEARLRRDERNQYYAAISRNLPGHWRIFGYVLHVDNASNIEIHRYDSSQAGVGFAWRFSRD